MRHRVSKSSQNVVCVSCILHAMSCTTSDAVMMLHRPACDADIVRPCTCSIYAHIGHMPKPRISSCASRVHEQVMLSVLRLCRVQEMIRVVWSVCCCSDSCGMRCRVCRYEIICLIITPCCVSICCMVIVASVCPCAVSRMVSCVSSDMLK